MKKHGFISLSTLIFLSSCGNENSMLHSPVKKADSVIGFKKEIPKNKDGSYNLYYEMVRQKAAQLNIDKPALGYDSLQIRIWWVYGVFINRELLVIKYTQGAWSAEHFNMTIDKDTRGNEIIITKKRQPVAPKSGWDHFSKELLDLGVTHLPDMNDIPGLQDHIPEGTTYNVEIATKDQYRFYSYHMPGKFEDRFPSAKHMTEILQLVADELGAGRLPR